MAIVELEYSSDRNDTNLFVENLDGEDSSRRLLPRQEDLAEGPGSESFENLEVCPTDLSSGCLPDCDGRYAPARLIRSFSLKNTKNRS